MSDPREPAYFTTIPQESNGSTHELNVVIMPEKDRLYINNTQIPINDDNLIFDATIDRNHIDIVFLEAE